jgi:hypothetical protein
MTSSYALATGGIQEKLSFQLDLISITLHIYNNNGVSSLLSVWVMTQHGLAKVK